MSSKKNVVQCWLQLLPKYKKGLLKCNFAGKLASLDPRLLVAEPDTAVNMFKEVLTKLVDKMENK